MRNWPRTVFSTCGDWALCIRKVWLTYEALIVFKQKQISFLKIIMWRWKHSNIARQWRRQRIYLCMYVITNTEWWYTLPWASWGEWAIPWGKKGNFFLSAFRKTNNKRTETEVNEYFMNDEESFHGFSICLLLMKREHFML